MRGDAIDLARVRVEGSNPEVLTWPMTGELREFWIRPGVLHVRYDQQGQWPSVDMGGALQEATVWVFVQIGGQWIGTGAERLRPNQIDKPQSDRPVETIGTSWLYAPDRWPSLAGYVPHDGELVGFLVAAGSTRSDFTVAVKARTNVVLTRFHDANGGGRFELIAADAPTPPAAQPLPPPAPDVSNPADPADAFEALEMRLDRIETLLKDIAARPDPIYSGTADLPGWLGGRQKIRLTPERDR